MNHLLLIHYVRKPLRSAASQTQNLIHSLKRKTTILEFLHRFLSLHGIVQNIFFCQIEKYLQQEIKQLNQQADIEKHRLSVADEMQLQRLLAAKKQYLKYLFRVLDDLTQQRLNNQ